MIRLTKYIVTFVVVAIMSGPAFAQIDYFEDFEGLSIDDPAALTDAGWLVFATVWNDYPGCNASYAYNYGVFGAPNGGPGFSSIKGGDSGQVLNAYSDYNNGDHNNGLCIETSLFQERGLTAADAGTYAFMFNTQVALEDDGQPIALGPDVVTNGFVKLLDPNNGYATVWSDTILTSAVGAKSISVVLDAAADGLLIQWGFSTRASNYEATGRWYDDVSFALEGTYLPPTGPSPVKYDGIPIPRWALLIMAGLLMYFGRTKLLARKET